MRIKFLCIAMLMLGFCCNPCRSEDVTNIDLQAVIARLSSIQNIQAKFAKTTTDTPRQALVDAIAKENAEGDGETHQTAVLHQGISTANASFSFLKGSCRWEVDVPSDSKPSPLTRYKQMIFSWESDRVEQLQVGFDNKTILGSITNQRPMPGASSGSAPFLDLALGLRAFRNDNWFSRTTLESMKAHLTDDGMFALEDINNSSKHQWIFDPKKAFALVRYAIYFGSQSEAGFEILNSDFKAVNGVMLPTHIIQRFRRLEGEKFVNTQLSEVTVNDYSVDDPVNKPSDYLMIWPVGTMLVDTRNKAQFVIKSAARTMTDEDIKNLLAKHAEDQNQLRKEIEERPGYKTGASTMPQ